MIDGCDVQLSAEGFSETKRYFDKNEICVRRDWGLIVLQAGFMSRMTKPQLSHHFTVAFWYIEAKTESKNLKTANILPNFNTSCIIILFNLRNVSTCQQNTYCIIIPCILLSLIRLRSPLNTKSPTYNICRVDICTAF